MDRRDCLASALAVGAAALNEAAGEDRNPAAQVADRTSTLRITGLRTFWAGPHVFLCIETNHGVVGWGEVKAVHPRVAKVLAEALFELIDGENPTRVEYLWQRISRSHRDMRGGPFMVHTLAGIDMALWDLTGKLWGVPVYRYSAAHAATASAYTTRPRRSRCRLTASMSIPAAGRY